METELSNLAYLSIANNFDALRLWPILNIFLQSFNYNKLISHLTFFSANTLGILSYEFHFVSLSAEKSRGVCETLRYALGGNKVDKAIFSVNFKVEVKVTRSLTLISFERASLVEYAYQIWSLNFLPFKSYSEG